MVCLGFRSIGSKFSGNINFSSCQLQTTLDPFHDLAANCLGAWTNGPLIEKSFTEKEQTAGNIPFCPLPETQTKANTQRKDQGLFPVFFLVFAFPEKEINTQTPTNTDLSLPRSKRNAGRGLLEGFLHGALARELHGLLVSHVGQHRGLANWPLGWAEEPVVHISWYFDL